MIGVLGAHAPTFLLVVAIGTVALFGLPLTLVPLRWAAVLGWKWSGPPDLAIYFGRCLGAVICVLGVAALEAAGTPALRPFFFELLAGATGAMVLVHAWGAIRRIQPPAETWEILYWVALFVLTLVFWPSG